MAARQGRAACRQGRRRDRKTARRYITAGIEAGLKRNDDEAQLTEALIGLVCQTVRPVRCSGHGDAGEVLLGEEERIKAWLAEGLTMTKAHGLLGRRGVTVPYRTMARFAGQRCGCRPLGADREGGRPPRL